MLARGFRPQEAKRSDTIASEGPPLAGRVMVLCHAMPWPKRLWGFLGAGECLRPTPRPPVTNGALRSIETILQRLPEGAQGTNRGPGPAGSGTRLPIARCVLSLVTKAGEPQDPNQVM